MRDRSNDDWVKAFQDEDSEALNELAKYSVDLAYKQLGKYQYFLHLSPDGWIHAAEDCAQDTMEVIIAKIESCVFTGSFVGWAAGITVRKVKQWIRTEIREDWPPIPEDLGPEEPNNMAGGFEQQELLEYLDHLMGRCTNEIERSIMALRHMERLRFKEIANILGKREDNVRMIHHRTLEKLRRKLREAGFL